MKRLNVLLLSVVALGITTVSCSKDEKDNSLKVPMGKWVFDTATVTQAGKTSAPSPVNNPDCEDVRYLNFISAGVLEEGYVDQSCTLIKYPGTYTQKGNDINIVEPDPQGDYTVTFTLMSVSMTKMTVKQIINNDPTKYYTINFVKI